MTSLEHERIQDERSMMVAAGMASGLLKGMEEVARQKRITKERREMAIPLLIGFALILVDDGFWTSVQVTVFAAVSTYAVHYLVARFFYK